MIIPALCRYYDILDADEDTPISKEGYSIAKVSFVLVLSADGELTNIIDLRSDEKKPRPKEMEVPKQTARQVNVLPYYLCDNAKYIFGVEKKKGDERKKILESPDKIISILQDTGTEITLVSVRSHECFNSFKELHHRLLDTIDDPRAKSLLTFLDAWNPDNFVEHLKISLFADDLLDGGSCIFQIGDEDYLHLIGALKKGWEMKGSENEEDIYMAQCLVCGGILPISRTHQTIKGVAGAQISGASLVSFNNPCFESYGKKQSYNAPISAGAEFKYTTVLKHLIANRSNRIRIGDSTTVFWAETTEKAGEDLAMFLINPIDDEGTETSNESSEGTPIQDVRTREQVREILSKVKAGKPLSVQDIGTDPTTNFYILGLSPNNARLSVRFWHQDHFGDVVARLARHHIDMEIIRDDSGPPYVSVFRLLRETVPKGSDNPEPSPIIGGLLMSSILNNSIYPIQLYYTILSRIKVERSINYVRAAFIKAYLLRQIRSGLSQIPREVVTVSLDEDNPSVPYRLGRLFAVLEKVQIETNKNMGSTINSKYFSSACATPAVVFPVLLKLAQHHIAKSDWGYKTKQWIEEILSGVEAFPAYLTLEDQGLFMLGYYHQSKAFFVKKDLNVVDEV